MLRPQAEGEYLQASSQEHITLHVTQSYPSLSSFDHERMEGSGEARLREGKCKSHHIFCSRDEMGGESGLARTTEKAS
jgi:hypothetical protein